MIRLSNEASPPTPVIAAKPAGHTFVWYGDCCTGEAGNRHSEIFAAVNAVFRRLDAVPDQIVFLGGNIMGGKVNAAEHHGQWRRWIERNPGWFNADPAAPIHPGASTHDPVHPVAEAVFCETFPDLPAIGPPDQQGLSYWVRDGDLLLVFVNTNFSGPGGSGHVASAWLDETLLRHADASHRLGFGHHPV